MRVFCVGVMWTVSSVMLLLMVGSCRWQQRVADAHSSAPLVVEAKGIVLPADSVLDPVVRIIDKKLVKTVQLEYPKVSEVDNNVRVVGALREFPLVPLRVFTPDPERTTLFRDYAMTSSTVPAGVPQRTIVKDAGAKDQNAQSFSSFGKVQGLRHGDIISMIEDRTGNLWLATTGAGVTKYDGTFFTHLTEKEGLPDDIVYDVSEDVNGDIWIATAKGTCRYDGKNITQYYDNKNQKLSVGTDVDSEGRLWMDSEGQRVRYYNGKTFTEMMVPGGDSNLSIANVFQDSKKNLWFSSGSKQKIVLTKYDGKSFSHFSFIGLYDSIALGKVVEDLKGNIWIASNGYGALRITPYGTGESTRYTVTHFSDTVGLINNEVRDIHADRKGNVWFSCNEQGICKYDGTSITRFTERNGLVYNDVSTIVEDKHGNMWFATQNSGICRYDGKMFTHISAKDASLNTFTPCVTRYKDRSILMCSTNGIVEYNGTQFSVYPGTGTYRSPIVVDRKGNLWFQQNGLVRYTPSVDGRPPTLTSFGGQDGLSVGTYGSHAIVDASGAVWIGCWNKEGLVRADDTSFTYFHVSRGFISTVLAILQDRNGEYWFGTFGGLYKMTVRSVGAKTSYSYTHWTVKEGLPHDVVNCILQDKRGDLWIGTNLGLCKYDGKTFTHYTEKEGLVNNWIMGMIEDRRGNIWIGTRNGISKLSLLKAEKIAAHITLADGEGIFKNFTNQDGYYGTGCVRNALCEDGQGTIWFSTGDRLTALHPDGESENSVPPNIQITNVNLFNEYIPWQKYAYRQDTTLTLGNGVAVTDFSFSGVTRWYGLPENLRLAYNNNYLNLGFVGITTQSPRQVRYRYKLEGIDDNWSAITSGTEAAYGNLPAGTYTFKVKAMNGEGHWSNEAQYTFTIRPPFWKTWWAYCLYIVMVAGSSWTYVRRREQSLRDRQKVLEQTVDERTAEVRAKKHEAEMQRERSDMLLLNILPAEVAEELKEKGKADAKLFDNVTVMMTDFKSFTTTSEQLSPQDLVNELHDCFKVFDDIIGRYNIEKIKTIGDAYLAVCGLPSSDKDHAEMIVRAAIDIRDFMLERRKVRGEKTFEIRIGINSGSVVAGIVGVKKFAYDIWGDTVNIAARMEQNSESGRINVSSSTYELVKEKFTCVYRGEIEAKNKGKLQMYFIDR